MKKKVKKKRKEKVRKGSGERVREKKRLSRFNVHKSLPEYNPQANG